MDVRHDRSRDTFIVALVLFLIALATATGQDASDPVMVGVAGRLTFGDDRTAIPVFAGSSVCGEFRTGTTQLTSFGLRALVPHFFSEGSGVSLGVSWGSESRDLVTPANEPIVRVSETDTTLEPIDHEYHLRTTSSLLRLDAAYRGHIAAGLSWSPSVWMALRSGFSSEQTERITGPSTALFDSGKVERPVAGGEPISLNPISAGIAVEFDYLLPLSRRIALQPSLHAEYEPFGPIREFTWTSIRYGFGLALLYTLPTSGEPPVPTPRDTTTIAVAVPRADTATSTPRRPTTLTASIEIYGIDDEERKLPAATVRIFQSITTQRLVPRNSVGFEPNSIEPDGRSTRLLHPDQTAYYSVDSLTGLSWRDIDREGLNILGAQLRDDTASRVTLRGSRTRTERDGLGRLRAERIARYLTDVWKIDPQRITALDAGTDNCTADRHRAGGCVGIEASPQWLVDTLVAERGTYVVVPPLLGIDPDYRSDAGIKRWAIEISHDGRTVGRYSSDTTTESDSTMSWDVSPERMSTRRSTLVADLTVEDSAGTVAHTRAPTPLIMERNIRITAIDPVDPNGRERIAATFYPFDEGSDRPNAQNLEAIDELAGRLRSGSRVTIAVDPDRGTGRKLSLARAAAVKRALENALRERRVARRTITIIPDRRNRNPLGHDLPEGGRGAFEIVVEAEN